MILERLIFNYNIVKHLRSITSIHN